MNKISKTEPLFYGDRIRGRILDALLSGVHALGSVGPVTVTVDMHNASIGQERQQKIRWLK